MLDRPFIEEGYRLYHIMSQPIGPEQRVKPRAMTSLSILLVERYFPSWAGALGKT